MFDAARRAAPARRGRHTVVGPAAGDLLAVRGREQADRVVVIAVDRDRDRDRYPVTAPEAGRDVAAEEPMAIDSPR